MRKFSADKLQLPSLKWSLAFIFALLAGAQVYCQQMPPRPVIVTPNNAQPLAFGAFAAAVTGGTVTVSPDGTRTASGDVVLFGMGYIFSPAMIYIRANPGTVISLLAPSPSVLTGSGGGSMTLTITGTQPATPFVTIVPWTSQTTVLVGGRLTVGNQASNPPGTYTGTFNITFVQE